MKPGNCVVNRPLVIGLGLGEIWSNHFYQTIVPVGENRIILSEDKNIIADPLQVADIFNLYYSSVSEYKDDDGLDIWTLVGWSQNMSLTRALNYKQTLCDNLWHIFLQRQNVFKSM